jgi:hypothetical protein
MILFLPVASCTLKKVELAGVSSAALRGKFGRPRSAKRLRHYAIKKYLINKMAKYSTGLLNQFVPHITELTECNAPSLEEYSDMSHGLISQFIILSSFSAKYPALQHKYALVFLRKTEAVFQEYFSSVKSLKYFVSQQHILYNENPNQQLSQYFEILHRIEILIALICQAFMVLENFLVLEKHERFWTKGDGTALERINILYNFTKHAEDKISQGLELPGYQLWLSNDGVSCEKGSVTFTEISKVLIDIADNAKYYGNPRKVIEDLQNGTYEQRLQKENNREKGSEQ